MEVMLEETRLVQSETQMKYFKKNLENKNKN